MVYLYSVWLSPNFCLTWSFENKLLHFFGNLCSPFSKGGGRDPEKDTVLWNTLPSRGEIGYVSYEKDYMKCWYFQWNVLWDIWMRNQIIAQLVLFSYLDLVFELGRVPGSPKNVFLPMKHVHSVNKYSSISTVRQGSEQSEWASLWTEWASKDSTAMWSAAERVSGVSGASERTQWVTEWPIKDMIICD